jgi:hypothetical protein
MESSTRQVSGFTLYFYPITRYDLTLNDSVNLPNDVLRKERLQLHVCCLSQKDVQSVIDALKPDATAHDVATAMLAIENNWPTPGQLIIVVNPQDKNKRIWLPHKLVSFDQLHSFLGKGS